MWKADIHQHRSRPAEFDNIDDLHKKEPDVSTTPDPMSQFGKGAAAAAAKAKVIFDNPPTPSNKTFDSTSGSSSTRFKVPTDEIHLAQPFELDGIIHKFKVGPCYGPTLKAASKLTQSLQDAIDRSYTGELIVRAVVEEERTTGLIIAAEEGIGLKDEPKVGGRYVVSRKEFGGKQFGDKVCDGHVIRVAVGGNRSATMQNALDEFTHDTFLKTMQRVDPGSEWWASYKTDYQNFRASGKSSTKPIYKLHEPRKWYVNRLLKEAHKFPLGSVERMEKIKFAYFYGRLEVISHCVAAEVMKKGTLASHAPTTAPHMYNFLRKVERKLGLPASPKLIDICFTPAQQLQQLYPDRPVAQYIARFSQALEKSLNSKAVQVGHNGFKYGLKGLPYGLLAYSVYSSYDPKQEDALAKAILDRTAVFTIDRIEGGILALGLAKLGASSAVSGGALFGMGIAASICANDPSFDIGNDLWAQFARKRQSEYIELFGPLAPPIELELLLGQRLGQALRWTDGDFLWRKFKEALPDDELAQDLKKYGTKNQFGIGWLEKHHQSTTKSSTSSNSLKGTIFENQDITEILKDLEDFGQPKRETTPSQPKAHQEPIDLAKFGMSPTHTKSNETSPFDSQDPKWQGPRSLEEFGSYSNTTAPNQNESKPSSNWNVPNPFLMSQGIRDPQGTIPGPLEQPSNQNTPKSSQQEATQSTSSNSGAKGGTSSTGPQSHDRGFNVSAGGMRDKAKEPPIGKPYGILRVTEDGYACAGVGVPTNIGNYPMQNSVEVQIDPKIFADLWVALWNRPVDKDVDWIETSHGKYKVKWYTQGHSVVEKLFGGTPDFRVEIRDPDGHHHHMWVKGKNKLSSKISEYVNEIIAKRMNRETAAFAQTLTEYIQSGDVKAAQAELDKYFNTHARQLPSEFKAPYQAAIDEMAAEQRALGMKNEPIAAIVTRLKEIGGSNVVSKAVYIEQIRLMQILGQRLDTSATEQDIKDAASLLNIGQGKYFEPTELNKVAFPPKSDFRNPGHHGSREEMCDRAKAVVDRLLTAYNTYILVIRNGGDEAAALRVYQAAVKAENETGKRDGLNIEMNDHNNVRWWVNLTYPEIMQCYEGKATWQISRQEAFQKPTSPFLSQAQLRCADIGSTLRELYDTVAIVKDQKKNLTERQNAYERQHALLQHLNSDEIKLTAADLQGENPNTEFVANGLKRYEWNGGSVACQDASDAILEIQQRHTEMKDDVLIYKPENLTAEERRQVDAHLAFLLIHAKEGSGVLKHAATTISEFRRSDISVQVSAYNTAVEILNNPDSKPEVGQEAFDNQYLAAMKLKEVLKVKPEDFDGKDITWIDATIEHYKFCEQSYEFSKGHRTIFDILKTYAKEKNGKKVVEAHRMTEAERREMLATADAMAKKNPPKGGEYDKFVHAALSHNYEILSDCYGKFAGLFVTTTLSDYSQRWHKDPLKLRAAQFITGLNGLCPSVLQDAMVLPWAAYWGHSSVAWDNLKQGFSQRFSAEGLMEHKFEIAGSVLKLVNNMLPFILDPKDHPKKYQALSVIGTAVSAAESIGKGVAGAASTALGHIPKVFDAYEFLVTQPEDNEEPTLWEKCKTYVHSAAMSVLQHPSLNRLSSHLVPGNLPESEWYYAIKGLVSNISLAGSMIIGAKMLKGWHGSHRDKWAAGIYVTAATTAQFLMGKFKVQRRLAVATNAAYHTNQSRAAILKDMNKYIQKKEYEAALPLLNRLVEIFDGKETHPKEIIMRVSALEKRATCLYNCASRLYKKGKQGEASTLLDELQETLLSTHIALDGIKSSEPKIVEAVKKAEATLEDVESKATSALRLILMETANESLEMKDYGKAVTSFNLLLNLFNGNETKPKDIELRISALEKQVVCLYNYALDLSDKDQDDEAINGLHELKAVLAATRTAVEEIKRPEEKVVEAVKKAQRTLGQLEADTTLLLSKLNKREK